MTKKPKTIAEWEKVCHNLNSALKLCIDQEEELIAALELQKADNKLLEQKIKSLEVTLDSYIKIDEMYAIAEERQDAEIESLNITITKSAGIINYLEHKLEQATQLKISGGED
jgi:predicted RNase H-like nuclease (RuvC/YqgF family)